MTNKVYDLDALGNINDLVRTTSTPLYPLGKIVTIEDDEVRNPEFLLEFIYIKNIGAVTINNFEPLVIKDSNVRNAEVFGNQVVVQEGTPRIRVAIPAINILAGEYGFVQLKGNTKALVEASVSISDSLQLTVNQPIALISTTNDKDRVGIAIGEALSGFEVIPILLLGNKVGIPTA